MTAKPPLNRPTSRPRVPESPRPDLSFFSFFFGKIRKIEHTPPTPVFRTLWVLSSGINRQGITSRDMEVNGTANTALSPLQVRNYPLVWVATVNWGVGEGRRGLGPYYHFNLLYRAVSGWMSLPHPLVDSPYEWGPWIHRFLANLGG